MEQSFINGKVNLLIENYKALNEVKGSWQMGLIQHSCALAFTLKNKKISPRLVEERIELIKKILDYSLILEDIICFIWQHYFRLNQIQKVVLR